LRGQNTLDWTIHYIIGNPLKHKCKKWACMIYLSTYNTSYGWKKGWESKCQFDSRPLKVKNRPEIHVCRWHVTYHWKTLNKGYNFVLIEGLHKKLWTSKMAKVPILWILKLPTWKFRKKWHLGAAPMAKHKEYYKGEGDGFPNSRLWWVLWVQVCQWFIQVPKMLQLYTNQQLVVLFMQVYMNNWPFITLLNPYPRALTHPTYLRSVAS